MLRLLIVLIKLLNIFVFIIVPLLTIKITQAQLMISEIFIAMMMQLRLEKKMLLTN